MRVSFNTGAAIAFGAAGAALLYLSIKKAAPTPPQTVSNSPAVSTSELGPFFDTLLGNAGPSPLNTFPDTGGISVAPTMPN